MRDEEAFEQPPDVEPPTNCSWLGEWEPTFAWDTTMDDEDEGEPVWTREALQHDGHEECCAHRQFVVLARAAVSDPEAPQ